MSDGYESDGYDDRYEGDGQDDPAPEQERTFAALPPARGRASPSPGGARPG